MRPRSPCFASSRSSGFRLNADHGVILIVETLHATSQTFSQEWVRGSRFRGSRFRGSAVCGSRFRGSRFCVFDSRSTDIQLTEVQHFSWYNTAMAYERYAAVYDGSGQVRFALLTAMYIEELLIEHPLNGRRLIDIACGTGTLALVMAAEGWEVLGLDSATGMLTQAEAKRQEAELSGRVAFMEADMRALAAHLPAEIFDLATCTYDSLNHLLEEQDLLAAFQGAAHVLRPGGLYIADMNTRYFLEHVWGRHEILEQRGYVQVDQSYFVAETSTLTMALTGFLGDDQQGYERFDELYRERAYPIETINLLLEQAGLLVEGCYESFTTLAPQAETHRIFWVARKPTYSTNGT